MKRFMILLACAVAATVAIQKADACTNVIISPGASADGSSMVSYAADSHWLFGELYFRKAASWRPGTQLAIYEWDTNKPLGSIAQAAQTYQTVGNMNEHQLIIGRTHHH